MYNSEILKLTFLLQSVGIPYILDKLCGGWIIKVEIDIKKRKMIDVVCNRYSYGHEEELLEIMGGLTEQEMETSSVLGWLDAEEAFRRIKWCYEHKTVVFSEDEAKEDKIINLNMYDYDSVKDMAYDVHKYEEKGYIVFVYNDRKELIQVTRASNVNL